MFETKCCTFTDSKKSLFHSWEWNELKFNGDHTLGLDGPEVMPVEWKIAAKVFGSNTRKTNPR